MPDKLQEPEETGVVVGGDSNFDFSTINPKEWECWGNYEPQHKECKGCPFNIDCRKTQLV